MNVEKLKRVAIKEFKRSPAKTGFLLVMLPVALYFCVPLLIGALKKSSPATGAAAVGAVTENASFVLPAATGAAVTPIQVVPSWDDVARSLESDMLAIPARIPATQRNPFAASKKKKNVESLAKVEDGERVAQPGTEAESAEPFEQIVTAGNPIRALGLELNATMVGQQSRLATINGKTYKEGETFPVPIHSGQAADTVATVPVELAHVDLRFVVLKMDRHEYQLQLPNKLPQDAIVVSSRPE